ncbi:hypothetical protein [Streptomyces aidingensis]|uniref:Uncharacterized protein n=1 Tax=Streptomyces aidingensis TaxID=910347 RepID=A0A1I1PU08_9ACTN|nr:hypothetical protein [Streptomyces aidingensis]SFD13424.1 hypothetical protein SAMN05421773_11058 [Streptomyces aidingensis]
MTRGYGRTRGYRPQDSELRPGKTVVPFGERTTICPACRKHKHASCWAHMAALGIGGEDGCPCGCHEPLDEPELTDEAIDDMAAHGTLAEHVKARKAWALGSGPAHFGEPCRRCAAAAAVRTAGGAR